MEFRKVKRYLLVSAICTAVITIAVTGVLLFLKEQTLLSLNVLLNQADEALSSGYYYKSEEATLKAFSICDSAESILRPLKRAYRICLATGKYELLARLSADALKKFPGSADIAFISRFGSLRAYGQGGNLLPDKAQADENNTSVYIEASLLAGIEPDKSIVEKHSRSFPELSLMESDDPKYFEQMGERLSEPLLYLDGALLYAGEGNIDDAYGLIEPQIIEAVGNEEAEESLLTPFIFISYDAGKMSVALDIFHYMDKTSVPSPSLRILASDMLILSSEIDSAEKMYTNALELESAFSAIPYLNLAWISMQKGQIEKAIAYLENARKLFPESREVSLELARLLFAKGDPRGANILLADILSKNNRDTEALLLRLRIEARDLSLSEYRVRLWDLFNKNPEDETAMSLLISHLLSFEDFDAARKAILIAEAQEPKEPMLIKRLSYYKGLLLALSGKSDDAIRVVKNSLSSAERGAGRYNLAVLYAKAGRYKEAESELGNILESPPDSAPVSPRLSSMALSLLGRIFMMENRLESARACVLRAIETDKGNYRAFSLLSEIEKKLNEVRN